MIHYRNVFGSLANDTRLNILMAINNHVAPEETLGGGVLRIVFKRTKREKFDSCRTKNVRFDGVVIIENR